MTMKPTRRRN